MKSTLSILALAGVGLALAGCETSLFRDRGDLVAETSPCATRRFEVYFNEGQARLTDAAREAINLEAGRLQGCAIRKVTVLGLADASGGAAANMDLSQYRAVAVAEALNAAGWPAPAFEIGAAGDAGAVTSAGAQEPLRRRTEVVVEAVAR